MINYNIFLGSGSMNNFILEKNFTNSIEFLDNILLLDSFDNTKKYITW